MTDKEIAQALHICGEGHPCRDCQLYGKEISCVETLCKYALALIERLTAENAGLHRQRSHPLDAAAERAEVCRYITRSAGSARGRRQGRCLIFARYRWQRQTRLWQSITAIISRSLDINFPSAAQTERKS